MRRRNTEMKKFRVLSSLLLGCLFVIMTVSSVRVSGQEVNTNKLNEVTGITTMSAQKEPFERSGYAHMRKLGFGGKKLTLHHEDITSMDANKDGKGEDGSGSSKISAGKENDGLKKIFRSLQEQNHDHQKHMIMGSKPHLKITKHVIPRSSPKSEQQNSEQPLSTAEKNEAQSVVDAANEVATLMYKDYKGRPSHKPPINNHVPGN